MIIKEYNIESSDIDPNHELKLSSLFRMMQDAATDAVHALGHGLKAMENDNLMWVITRHELEIYRNFKFTEKVVVKTYAGKDMLFIFPRYFQIENEKGEILMRASSTWCVLSSLNRKVVTKPFGNEKFPLEHLDGELELPIKIQCPLLNKNEDRIVRYSDVDLNGHLNNTKYIEYVLDLHSLDFLNSHQIKRFVINYEHEAKYGDVISFSSNFNNDVEYINGKINNVNVFDVMIEFK